MKPFVVLVNSVKPYSEETEELVESIKEKYQLKIFQTGEKNRVTI